MLDASACMRRAMGRTRRPCLRVAGFGVAGVFSDDEADVDAGEGEGDAGEEGVSFRAHGGEEGGEEDEARAEYADEYVSVA